MTIYNVQWTCPAEKSRGQFSPVNLVRSKPFSKKDLAESFVHRLIDAAALIGVTIDPRIHETEID